MAQYNNNNNYTQMGGEGHQQQPYQNQGGYQQTDYNQQQQYGAPSGAPPQSYPMGPPNYNQQGAPPVPSKPGTFEDKFQIDKPKYNDLWAGILLIITFLGFLVVSIISLRRYSAAGGFIRGGGIYGGAQTVGLNTNTLVLFIFVLVVAFVLSLAVLGITRAFTKQVIWITGILNIVLAIGTAIYYFSEKYYSAAIIFLIFGVFYAFCFWSWRSRIPFTVLMLQTVIDVSRNYGHVYLASLIGGIIALAFSAWFSVTLVAIYVAFSPTKESNGACNANGGSCSNAKVIGLIVFITFAGYWITEFIKNVLHVSVAGVYGSWYFSAGGSNPGQKPSHPTLGAFRRAMTYSFGSIAFGSLLVAIIQLLKQAASVAGSDARNSGDMIQYVIFCVLQCILSLVEWAINFINEYAFSFIALYGDAYIPAAKKTWTLFKDRGIDALIQDCLINPVLTMGALFVAYVGTLLAYLYLRFTKPVYNQDGDYTPMVMAFSFLICLQIGNIMLNPLKSGVTSIFVAMAVNPEVMQVDHADLYQRMVSVYPRVAQIVNV